MTDQPQPAAGPPAGPEPAPSGPYGPPPVVDGEHGDDYEAALARIVRSVRPADMIEEIWAREFADLSWEAQRLRRFKAGLLRSAMRRALQGMLRPIIYSDRLPGSDAKDYPDERTLAAGWAEGDRRATERVEKLLRWSGSSIPAVAAEALANRIDEVERIDRMIALAEQRRISVLREIEGHRARRAKAREQAAQQTDAVAAETATAGAAEDMAGAQQPA